MARDGAYTVLDADPVMAELVDEHGHLSLADADPDLDAFQRMVVSIINQQLSTASAAAIRDRVFDAVTVTPDGILDADEETLRETGLSRQKIDYVRSAAETFRDEDLDRDRFAAMDDDAVIDTLTDIHGVGVWTAKMYCMFVLHREDIFPVEDLGIRRGMEALFGDLSREEMVERAERWRPYRSTASLHIWRQID